jgi:hypothetical protein
LIFLLRVRDVTSGSLFSRAVLSAPPSEAAHT